MTANSVKSSRTPFKGLFNRLSEALSVRGWEKSAVKGGHYWRFQFSPDFHIYVWDGVHGSNKLFIDGRLSSLAQALGTIQGVKGSLEGVTENSKFERFSAQKVSPFKNKVVYEGWKFQFTTESAANKFFDVCELYKTAGIDAAITKARSFTQTPERVTERTSVVATRVGQESFRKALLRFWKACAVTGCKVTDALRASHIKPWAVCNANERLDTLNGLLLLANLDALFDAGLITFEDNGLITISSKVSESELPALGLSSAMHLRKVNSAHLPYLAYHREHVFKK